MPRAGVWYIEARAIRRAAAETRMLLDALELHTDGAHASSLA